jgi:hypothetical protein
LQPLPQEFIPSGQRHTGNLCSFCNIIYYPNNQLVKKANRFEVPYGSDPNVDKSPPIVMMGHVNKDVSSTLYKQQKLAAAYKALQHQGFKFTTYEGINDSKK